MVKVQRLGGTTWVYVGLEGTPQEKPVASLCFGQAVLSVLE